MWNANASSDVKPIPGVLEDCTHVHPYNTCVHEMKLFLNEQRVLKEGEKDIDRWVA